MTTDPLAFRAFEATAWDRIPDPYQRFFGPITSRAIDPLLDAVRLQAGDRLLDIATGPGHIAGRAAARGAIATGIDIAGGMIATAARNHPAVSFRVSPAEELPFASGSFEAAVSGFGLGHFAEPMRVVAELARAVTSGGRVALAWWDEPARSRVLGVFHEALARTNSPAPVGVPPGLPFFQYSTEPEFLKLLQGAGLVSTRLERLSFRHQLRSPDELWSGVVEGSVRTAAAILGQTAEKQQAVRAVFDELVGPYRNGDVLEIPVAVVIGHGVVP